MRRSLEEDGWREIMEKLFIKRYTFTLLPNYTVHSVLDQKNIPRRLTRVQIICIYRSIHNEIYDILMRKKCLKCKKLLLL